MELEHQKNHPSVNLSFALNAFVCVQDNTCKTSAMVAADYQVAVDIAFLAQVRALMHAREADLFLADCRVFVWDGDEFQLVGCGGC